MNIIAWLPNPEQDLKTPSATQTDVLISFVCIFLIMIIFGIYRKFRNK